LLNRGHVATGGHSAVVYSKGKVKKEGTSTRYTVSIRGNFCRERARKMTLSRTNAGGVKQYLRKGRGVNRSIDEKSWSRCQSKNFGRVEKDKKERIPSHDANF